MKKTTTRLGHGVWGRLGGCLVLAMASGRLLAQVLLLPGDIHGTVSFTNSNPAILDLLTAGASPEQTTEMVIYANSLPPAGPVQTVVAIVTNGAAIPYDMTVDTAPGGVAYSLSPTWYLGPGDTYYFPPQETPPLVPGEPPTTLDFATCAGVFELHFTDSGGGPVAIQGLRVQVYSLVDNSVVAGAGTAGADGVPPGTGITTKSVLVPGGGTYWLDVTCRTGTNYYVDTLNYELSLTNTVACDQIVPLEVVVPKASQLATITGKVGLVGEFALTVPSYPPGGPAEYPGFTLVQAYYGPFNNTRWAAVNGVNFTASADGAFVLTNLVPNDPANPQQGYYVGADLAVRTNRDYAFFQSPRLGYPPNPQVVLSPGTNADLGDLFLITPGYVEAPLILKGPPEAPGQASALRNLYFGTDGTDPWGYGLPNGVILYGIIGTAASMEGTQDIAPGAAYAAAYGFSSSGGTGAFNPATASYEGRVNLPLGGLASQPSFWKRYTLGFVIDASTNGPDSYISESGAIYCQETNSYLVNAGITLSNQVDFNFAFSKVALSIVSQNSQFRNPAVRDSSGNFNDVNFLGKPDNYQAVISAAYGTPAYFTNQGLVVMYLPQGTYTLAPSVESLDPDGATSYTQLEPINLTVGVGQQIYLQSGLQVQLSAPACAGTSLVPITGQVLGSNAIASVTLSVNGGPPTPLCSNCGVNPTFADTVLIAANDCADTTVTVAATDVLGEIASTTSTIHFDHTPPTLQVPTNLVVGCSGSGGAVVNFSVTATDNCPGPVAITCTPPSGSAFPVGTTLVHCQATDGCGNTSTGSFTVTVEGSAMTIQHAIGITWACGGTLQSAPSPQGPWTTIPGAVSPYFTIPTSSQQYFRIGN